MKLLHTGSSGMDARQYVIRSCTFKLI
uniref:Uncharacterized protein n=1 Tax=Anguilla anguilla TaxID=7936 RepID=A0A0E9SZQ8_ANGAN